uniref:Uncharacterized protein n=1 Tax=Pristionchus pacificus TaxID=54126 RepID=A0A2A6CM50_PRIPA|eukprot:PDM79186.1 hypothetical protein PRIPAC_31765 [Pristionchus pacificus]
MTYILRHCSVEVRRLGGDSKKEISEREKEKERKANAERQERNERQTKKGQINEFLTKSVTLTFGHCINLRVKGFQQGNDFGGVTG